jgi:hypothetical protein
MPVRLPVCRVFIDQLLLGVGLPSPAKKEMKEM